ncbi:DUF3868 domain-containing protein [uncultured Parabacteroides sp.]|uniref:DUF3868 domain-containing protein n=1 Tax=uncultured Parabacteroides sp. TaxID=512312 RepID=UPI0025D953CF|nr:DUF3868 domain-containing protein [uncultured Parabacteroides sp.]
MKNIKKLSLMAMLLSAGMLTAMAQTNSPIHVTSNDLTQKGDSLYIDATIRVQSKLIESRKSLTLTPVIENNSQREGLPNILLNGKNRSKVYKREKALNNLKNEEPHFIVLRAPDATEHVINYKMAIAWEPWMKDARFVLAQDLCGCGKEEAVGPLLIADKIRMAPTERYQVQPTLAYITPEAETEKHRAEVGTAYLEFQVGKSVILNDFRNNASELAKIENTINTVIRDKNITPKGIMLKGYASPEGSYASNQRLADSRVRALRDYIRVRNNFGNDFFIIESEPEDWAGFKAAVEKDSEVPARSEVLAIINSDDMPDVKEAKLKTLQGGAAYRYVLNTIFPSLRRSDYRIDYTVREFTVEEGREIIKTRPQQLSLSEMFAVANSYETGSEAYNEVFDIAVRMYSSDPVANLNAANIAIGRGDYASAAKYLDKAGISPEASHARGVMFLIEGNLDAAEPLLKKAAEAGIEAASANLKELQKKRENDELFKSFGL